MDQLHEWRLQTLSGSPVSEKRLTPLAAKKQGNNRVSIFSAKCISVAESKGRCNTGA